MKTRRTSTVLLSVALSLPLLSQARAESPKTEIKGAAILDHPCGKVAVKYMELAHDGKMEEATGLGTQEMQDQWKAMSAEDRTMMAGMMKEMSKTKAVYTAEIKANGLLVVEGDKATLTITQEHNDANHKGTSTQTQRYRLDGGKCFISR